MSRPGPWPPLPEALPSPIVDNHAHLEWPAGDEPKSVAQRLEEAAQVGVTRVVQVGCELASARWTVGAVEEHPQLVGAVALHPNEAPLHAARTHKSEVSYPEAFAEIADLASHERIRAVGETGLDFFRTDESGRAAQVEAFRDHIRLAKEYGKPLQIHDRDAHREVIDILDRDGAPEVTVFHCFSGDADMADVCAERGWYLSFAGTVTFRNAADLREALVRTPMNRVLVETDAPFLTPHPHRGAPNSPAMAALTMGTIAEVKGYSLADACMHVSHTSEEVYGPW